MECCNNTSLSDYLLSESVAHGNNWKKRTKFPKYPDRESVRLWLDANGFRYLGVWDPDNASALQTASGLRYIEGQWMDENSKWFAIRSDGGLGMTIRLGKSRDGKLLRSDFYDRGNVTKTKSDFSDMDEHMQQVKGTG